MHVCVLMVDIQLRGTFAGGSHVERRRPFKAKARFPIGLNGSKLFWVRFGAVPVESFELKRSIIICVAVRPRDVVGVECRDVVGVVGVEFDKRNWPVVGGSGDDGDAN